MGAACVFAGLMIGAFVLGRGDRSEGPLVWLCWGLIGLGVFLLQG